MAETNKTFGVKVPEDLHQEATELMRKLNLTGEGFLNELINVYKAEKAKEDVPVFAEDLKELQALAQRISGIYLNMAYRVENINKVAEQDKVEQLTKKDFIISDLQNKNSELNQSIQLLTESFNTSCEDKNILNNQVNQLTDNVNTIKALNEEYKNKIDTMAGIVEEYKEYKEHYVKFQKKIQELSSRNTEVEIQLKDKLKEVIDVNKIRQADKEEYKNALDALREENKLVLAKIQKEHENTLKQAESAAEVQKEKAILEIEKNHQKELQEMQHNFNSTINEYQAKYKALLDEKENAKASTNKAVK